MAETRMERDFPVSPEILFDFVTTPERLGQWFGPEGTRLDSHDLNLCREGPWFARMVGLESGNVFKVSGVVTRVDPPRSVGFTWAWHDDEDQRGAESFVSFIVEPSGDGARFIIDHRDLPDDEAAEAHTVGWTSTLRRLTDLISKQGE